MSADADTKYALVVLKKIRSQLILNNDSSRLPKINHLIAVLESPMFQKLMQLGLSLDELHELQKNDLLKNSDDFEIDADNASLLLSRHIHDLWQSRQSEEEENRSIRSWDMSCPPDFSPPPLPPDKNEFETRVGKLSNNRPLVRFVLNRELKEPLGLSVIGLKSKKFSNLGVYVEALVPGGLADRSGYFKEGDQIIAIEGIPLDSDSCQDDSVALLATASDSVSFVLARDPLLFAEPAVGIPTEPSSNQNGVLPVKETVLDHTNSSSFGFHPDMLTTEWTQLEVIDLVNDGNGLGFGIIGGRGTGVVVRTILPGSVADKDGRLQPTDHILQIGHVNVRPMTSDQVATVLRQSGDEVRLIVARPFDHNSPRAEALITQGGLRGELVQTSQLEARLETLVLEMYNPELLHQLQMENQEEMMQMQGHQDMFDSGAPSDKIELHPVVENSASTEDKILNDSLQLNTSDHMRSAVDETSDVECFYVTLNKGESGLGITIAGYISHAPGANLKGIFVKEISPGSTADLNGGIKVNDKIIEVDNISLSGFDNRQAVDILKNTGATVHLRIARYKSGPIYHQLCLIAERDRHLASLKSANQSVDPSLPQSGDNSRLSMNSHVPLDLDESTLTEPPTVDLEPHETTLLLDEPLAQICGPVVLLDDPIKPLEEKLNTYEGPVDPETEITLRRKWQETIGRDHIIVIAHVVKFSDRGGLGVSLEGTVDVEENGIEVRPHHYIRDIMKDGPVGIEGTLTKRDELLEVNDRILYGLNHTDVIQILKNLPRHVRIVCSRKPEGDLLGSHSVPTSCDSLNMPGEHATPLSVSSNYESSADNRRQFHENGVLTTGGNTTIDEFDDDEDDEDTFHYKPNGYYDDSSSFGESSLHIGVKSKSEENINHFYDSDTLPFRSATQYRARSMDPMDGLSIWSSEVQDVVLYKGANGLGFSILDYQDPMNPRQTVIVIRSLVPHGVADQDGRILPGDRLVHVNYESMEHAELETAVKALKSTPRGNVTLGIVKAYPLTHRKEATSEDPNSTLDFLDKQYNAFLDGYDDDEEDEDDEDLPERLSTGSSPSPVPVSNQFILPPVPPALEQRFYVRKRSGENIGLDANEGDPSVNGWCVHSIIPDSPLSRHGRLEVGDFVCSLGEENLRGLLCEDVGEVFKRITYKSGDVKVCYIPSIDALVHKQSAEMSAREFQNNSQNFQSSANRVQTKTLPTKSLLFTHVNSRNPASSSIHSSSSSLTSEISSNTRSQPPSIPEIPGNNRVSSLIQRFSSSTPITDTSDEDAPCKSRAKPPVILPNKLFSPRLPDKQTATSISQSTSTSSLSTAPPHPAKKLTESSTNDSIVRSSRLSSSSSSLNNPPPISASPILIANTDTHAANRLSSHRASSTASESCSTHHLHQPSPIDPKEGMDLSTQRSGDSHNSSSPSKTDGPSPSPSSSPLKQQPSLFISTTKQHQLAQQLSTDRSLTTPSPVLPRRLSKQQSVESTLFYTMPAVALGAPQSDQKAELACLSEQNWCTPREVIIARSPGQSLGISIVGGRATGTQGNLIENSVNGIFIKEVKEGSYAERLTDLKAGDRILEVNAVNLRNKNHEEAVEIIRNAKSPVKLLVQTIMNSACPSDLDDEPSVVSDSEHSDAPVSPGNVSLSISPAIEDTKKESNSLPKRVDTTDEDEDSEEEDEFGYTKKSLIRKYGDLGGELLILEIPKSPDESLGVKLSGNKDLNTMSIYICGMQRNGAAEKDGSLQIGDEILEVDGHVLYGRSHVNATPVLRNAMSNSVKLVVHRDPDNVGNMAVKPSKSQRRRSAQLERSPDYSRRGSAVDFWGDYSSRRTSCASSIPEAPREEIIHINLVKGDKGLGFAIMEGSYTDEPGIYIKHVSPGGVADKEGTLHPGDRLIEVDGHDITSVSYDTALDRLRSTQGEVSLVVSRIVIGPGHGATLGNFPSSTEIHESPIKTVAPPITTCEKVNGLPPENKSPIQTSSPVKTSTNSSQPDLTNNLTPSPKAAPVSRDPATCPVETNVETVIEFEKKSIGLGIKVIGGCDTNVGCVLIREIFDKGSAALDGRLRVGDQIMAINNTNLRATRQSDATKALQVPNGRVSLTIFRHSPVKNEAQLYNQPIKVELTRKPGKGFGFSIIGRQGKEKGVFINDIVKGSPAESDGKLQMGDQLLEVNGEDVRHSEQEYVAALIKAATGKVVLTLGRIHITERRASTPGFGKGKKGKSPSPAGRNTDR